MNWLWDRTVASYLASGVAHLAAVATMHTMLGRTTPVSVPVRNGVNSMAMTATIELQPVQETTPAVTTAVSFASGDEQPGEQLAAQTRELFRAADSGSIMTTARQVPAEFNSHHPASPAQRAAGADEPQLAVVESPPLPRQDISTAQPSASSQAALDSVFSAGELRKSPPRPRYNPAPLWPADLLAARRSGVVVLRIRIAADGQVLYCAVHRSSGFAAFDQAALTAVKRWQFEPAERFGLAIEAEILHPIRFQIEAE